MSSKDIKDVAARYLYYRERSTFEVNQYLKLKGYSEEEIQEAIEYLHEFHYLDDERFCNHYLHYGLSKGKGPIRLRYELKEKGITTEIIQKALEEKLDSITEKMNALEQANKLLNGNEGYNEKLLAKVGRRLSGLGYNTTIIYQVLEDIKKMK